MVTIYDQGARGSELSLQIEFSWLFYKRHGVRPRSNGVRWLQPLLGHRVLPLAGSRFTGVGCMLENLGL